ncbi:MAG: hypothetical protein QGG48_11520, partial [Desulfatiglandales bacterium]|nr:hypothetical protein [Desulfatiglandales bacterium]
SPLMDSFLIAWRDENAPDDYAGIPNPDSPFPLYFDGPSDVMAVVYGTPSFCSGRVTARGTEEPVENVRVIVIGPGTFKMTTTNEGGWWNIPKESQRNGRYFVFVMKGLRMGMQSVNYEGEPLKTTIDIRS